MLTVNIQEVKTQLSRLVELAAQGVTFIVAKTGKPIVKVIPLGKSEQGTMGRLGSWRGSASSRMILTKWEATGPPGCLAGRRLELAAGYPRLAVGGH